MKSNSINENKNIGKSAAILTISKVITMLITLASGMLLSRFRTLEEYGTYSEIHLVVSLAVTLFMLGLPNSTNYFLARCETPEERQRFLSVYYTLSTFLCFITGAVLTISVPLIVRYFKNELIRDFIYLLILLPWTKGTISSISNVLVVYGKTKKLALFNCLSAAVALISILITKLLGWSFREYMYIYMFGELVLMIWTYAIVWNLANSLKIRFDKELIYSIFKYSVPIGLASLVGTVMNDTDKLIIGQLLNTENLAIYTNAARELPFTVIAASFTAVLLPQMAHLLKDTKTNEAISLWGDTVELSFIFMSFVVTALVVFAPQIVTILYSEKYLDGVNVFRCYAIVLLVRITSFGMILNATGHTKFVFYNSIIAMIINILLDYIFYSIFGFIGPAIATAVTHLASALIYLSVSSRVLHIPFVKMFPWKRLALHTLINLTWGAVAMAVLYYANIGTSNKEIIYCVCSGMGIVLLYWFIERRKIKSLWSQIN